MARKGGVQAARMFNRLDLPAIGSYFRQKAQRRPRAAPRIESIAADQVQPGEASRFAPGVERQEMVEGVSMIFAVHSRDRMEGRLCGSVSAQDAVQHAVSKVIGWYKAGIKLIRT
jgi:hypothetical protein